MLSLILDLVLKYRCIHLASSRLSTCLLQLYLLVRYMRVYMLWLDLFEYIVVHVDLDQL